MKHQRLRQFPHGLLALALVLFGVPDAAAQEAITPSVAAEERAAGETIAEAADTAEPPSSDIRAAEEPPFTMRIGARLQVRYSHVLPDEGDAVGAFAIRRARLSAKGDAYQRFRYALQLELAGEVARLLDANVRVPLAPFAEIWAGQGKTPFGRQQLNSSGNLQFVDRSITNSRFTHGRDLGLMLQGETDRFGYNAGLFNGEGPGVAANPAGRFMTVARAYVTPFGRYQPTETAFDMPATPRLAVGASVMRNPLGAEAERSDVTRYGLEAAFKVRGLDLTGEYFRENADLLGSTLSADGWHAQAGYLLPGGHHSIAGRYAVVGRPEAAGLDEAGVGYSYYLREHRAKVQADLRNIRDRQLDTSRREVRVQLQLSM